LGSKEHLHEYDDNWKCRCGQKLVVDIVEGNIKIKGFMTPEGEFVQLSQALKIAVIVKESAVLRSLEPKA
jgi:hypothetical protein